jgi:hypothetical protein
MVEACYGIKFLRLLVSKTVEALLRKIYGDGTRKKAPAGLTKDKLFYKSYFNIIII